MQASGSGSPAAADEAQAGQAQAQQRQGTRLWNPVDIHDEVVLVLEAAGTSRNDGVPKRIAVALGPAGTRIQPVLGKHGQS